MSYLYPLRLESEEYIMNFGFDLFLKSFLLDVIDATFLRLSEIIV
jgi:hypothetical protein